MAAWLKTHPDKRAVLERVTFAAEGLWHAVNLYCAAVGNNGVLPAGELSVACSRKITAARGRALARELVLVGLWRQHPNPDRYELVDWLKDQPAAEVWTDDTKRERWARGKALHRDRVTCRKVQARDLNRCRYCAIRVDWTNRRGPNGGTYDHVDPDGDNLIRNVVVACRRCNAKKKDRTPAQANMSLLSLLELRRLASAEEVPHDLDAGAGPDEEPEEPDEGPKTRAQNVQSPSTHFAQSPSTHLSPEAGESRANIGPNPPPDLADLAGTKTQPNPRLENLPQSAHVTGPNLIGTKTPTAPQADPADDDVELPSPPIAKRSSPPVAAEEGS